MICSGEASVDHVMPLSPVKLAQIPSVLLNVMICRKNMLIIFACIILLKSCGWFNIHVAKCLQASSLLCSWSAIPNSEISRRFLVLMQPLQKKMQKQASRTRESQRMRIPKMGKRRRENGPLGPLLIAMVQSPRSASRWRK